MFIRRGAVAGSIRIVGLVCILCLQILLARLIADAGEYGKYAWSQSLLFMTGSLAGMGVPTATSRFVASLVAQGNERAISRVVRKALQLLSSASAALLITAAGMILFRPESAGGHVYYDLVIVSLSLAPAFTFAMFLRELAKARQWIVLAFLPLQVLRPITTALLAAIIWWSAGRHLAGASALLAVGASLFILIVPQGVLYRRRQTGRIRSDKPAATRETDVTDYHQRHLLRTALPIFTTRCAGLAIQYSNVLMIGFLSGPLAAGAYFAAERLSNLASIPGTVVSSINQPPIAAAHAVGDAAKLQAHTTLGAHGSLWPTLVVGLALAIFSSPLLSLFGKDFAQASPVLLVLVVSNIVGSAFGPVQDLLIMTGHQRAIPRVMISSAVLHVLTLLILVPSLGAIGAACASTASRLLSGYWMMVLARRKTGVDTTVMHTLSGAGKHRA